MARIKQICLATLLLCGAATAQRTSEASYPYLLRLEHSTFEGHSCALLQTTGAFHLEVTRGGDVKVFEGTTMSNNLREVEADLNNGGLLNLSQEQIEEPLIRTRHDELQVTVLRSDGWQDLYFRSSDSQQPFKQWLQPLARWLENLHKLPHRQLSEDEGKNNCLPPRPITLKKRDAQIPPPITSKVTANVLYPGPAPQPPPLLPANPQSGPPLLHVYSFEMGPGRAHEFCALINQNGMYRLEDRTQKTAKPVNSRIVGGHIATEELRQLHQILDDPALVGIKHHEPPGRGDVPMMGDKLDISISRSAGVQRFILSSRFNRPDFPSFYRGDADVTAAQPLLKFLTEHLENGTAGTLDPSKRNDCSEAP